MARDNHINAAGGFLRAMRGSSRPGGQSLRASPLPVKSLLLALEDRGRTSDELAIELGLEDATVLRALENLVGLGLVEIAPTDEGEVAQVTDLGREVGRQQREH